MTPNDLDLLLLLAAQPTLTLEEARRQLAALRSAHPAPSGPTRAAPSARMDESSTEIMPPQRAG